VLYLLLTAPVDADAGAVAALGVSPAPAAAGARYLAQTSRRRAVWLPMRGWKPVGVGCGAARLIGAGGSSDVAQAAMVVAVSATAGRWWRRGCLRSQARRRRHSLAVE